MANTPLSPVIKTSVGRVAQLELGVGENQFTRASDVNQVITYLNDRASANKGTVTQATSTTTGVTLNNNSGTITCFTSTAATTVAAEFTLTNSNINANSIVLGMINAYSGTTGHPAVTSIICSAGSALIKVTNTGTAVLNGVYKVSFIVF